jgi:phosphatidylinositol alpha-mannosyltransferase
VRIGIVCPYSFDVPGGVQFHVRDLAEHLLSTGHDVSVLAPADEDTPVPPYVVTAGRAVPVPYNGAVARLTFGPLSAARVRRWLAAGEFEVLHVHEPATPSLSLLACWAASGPIVGTFHTASLRSRAMQAAYPILYPVMEKISGRIAVSEEARRTLVEHLGGDAVVVPNGIYVDRFTAASPRAEWRGQAGTVGFVGRLDEPRKGLPVLLRAFESVVAARPGTRLLVAGRGDEAEAAARLPDGVRDAVTFLGQIDDADKAALLRTVDAYVAPNLGGESFGIVLIEAMAAGAPVIASEIEAFSRVLDGGRAGVLVPVDDAAALTRAILTVLADPERRRLLSAAGAQRAQRYDWGTGCRRDPHGLRDRDRGGRHRRRGRARAVRPVAPVSDVPLASTAVAVVVLLGWYLSWTASRLDRLHARVEGSRAALDAQLVRRSSVALELATYALLDPASAVLLASAAHDAREAPPAEREIAESNLSAALRAALDEPEAVAEIAADPHGLALLDELSSACKRVELSRRFHNDAVRAAHVVRRKRLVRWFRLGGHAPAPHTLEIDDSVPPALARLARSA